jgi:ectoine hydroxylase-related dioxygenase (phytanoyl-CoA dioxygenase family)
MLELLDDSGATRVVSDYFGSRPIMSAHKTTLRRVAPHNQASWHQDGSFMHNATALNVWVALTHCGDDAPGIDLVPRRLNEIVVSHEDMRRPEAAATSALAAAAEVGVVRPIFEPGDALFFDEMFLHRTAAEPSMPNDRFAIETWFFPESAFPADYAPLAV